MRFERRERNVVITSLTIIFIVVVMMLIANGGQCERYERKMLRQQLMREQIDSIRREEQLKKLSP